MQIVLNEVKQAEEIIRTGEVGTKPSSTLFLLGKYYRNKMNLNKQKTSDKLNSFMKQNYRNYNPVLWEEIIDTIAKKAKKYSIREIDAIGITKYELDCIMQLENIKYEKLVFTMLCHAKLYNMISKENTGWINTNIPEIYRLSRVAVKHRNDKFLYLNDIEQNKLLDGVGLISFSNKNENLNIKINFVDMKGEPILFISDFRELGYEYLCYYGLGSFTRCKRCGRLLRKKSIKDFSTKYCSTCATYIKNEQNKKYYNQNLGKAK